MSILIKDMKMPENCRDCLLCAGQANMDYGVCVWCRADGKARDAYTRQDCPLVEVPTPHGRLIDESKVLDIVSEWCPDDDGSVGKYGDLREMLDEIEAIPTIIPASEAEAWAK